MDNNVHVMINNTGRAVSSPIWTADYGLQLVIGGLNTIEINGEYSIDFADNAETGTSITVPLISDRAEIPKDLIDTGKDLFAFLYVRGEDFGRTVQIIKIPNKVRPARTQADIN